jgi:hypothetical protein
MCVNFSVAQVQVQINKDVYNFDLAPRLAEVLTPIANSAEWYWPSAQLYNLNAASIEKQRQTLIQQLRNDSSANEAKQEAYEALINQLSAWRLADRIQIKIDFDLARVSPAQNPKFDNGEYLLRLSTRPSTFEVFGAVMRPSTLKVTNNTCIRDILADVIRLQSADHNQVYIISPTGQIEIAPIAYWNHRCVVPMPGSSLYIPLQENQWFEHASIINQQVASLALNRIRTQ